MIFAKNISRYQDKWLRLLGIPIGAVIVFFLCYHSEFVAGKVFTIFIFDLVIFAFAWEFIRYSDNKINEYYSWTESKILRILIQLSFGFFLVLLVLIILHLSKYYFLIGKLPPDFFTTDLLIYSISIFLINVLYLLLSIQSIDIKTINPENLFSLKIGLNENVAIERIDVYCFYCHEGQIFVITKEQKKYLLNASLKRIEDTLAETDFFRANRQFIISRDIIHEVHDTEDNRLIITLEKSQIVPLQIVVSRNRAPLFKEWYHTNKQTLEIN